MTRLVILFLRDVCRTHCTKEQCDKIMGTIEAAAEEWLESINAERPKSYPALIASFLERAALEFGRHGCKEAVDTLQAYIMFSELLDEQ
jgi:hypothetical protein